MSTRVVPGKSCTSVPVISISSVCSATALITHQYPHTTAAPSTHRSQRTDLCRRPHSHRHRAESPNALGSRVHHRTGTSSPTHAITSSLTTVPSLWRLPAGFASLPVLPSAGAPVRAGRYASPSVRRPYDQAARTIIRRPQINSHRDDPQPHRVRQHDNRHRQPSRQPARQWQHEPTPTIKSRIKERL